MAIHFEVRQHPLHGRILFMTDGKTEVGGALDFGVRIVHLAAAGRENLLYEQPADLSDSLATPEGWRIHGGHRFWAAPESSLSYYPDNDPVDCERLPSGFVLRQRTDPWTGMQKELAAVFADDGSLCVTHTLIYEGEESVQAAAWGVTTLKGGGEAFYPFPKAEGSEFSVNRTLALWGDTALSDERLVFEKDGIRARHTGSDRYFKLGIYSAAGNIRMWNLGQELTICFDVYPMEEYAADRGCNAELYLNPHIMELETLGVTGTLRKGERVSHTETWKITEEPNCRAQQSQNR